MSKFCEECGSPLEENASFCENCGTAVPQEVAAPAGNVFTKFVDRLKSDKKFAIIVGGIAVALVLVIVLICVFAGGGSSYSKALDNYFAVMGKGETKKIEALAPPEYWEYLEDEEDQDMDDVIDSFEDYWDEYSDYMEDEYGKNIKISYEILDEKELSEKKLEGIGEALEDTYDIDAKDVTAGYDLELEVTIKGSEDDDSEETEMSVVKINGDWYVISWYKSGSDYYAHFLVG